MSEDADPVEMTRAELQRNVDVAQADPKVVQVCAVGGSEWVTADLVGITSDVPF